MKKEKSEKRKGKEGLSFSFWSRLYDTSTSSFGYGKGFRRENLRLAKLPSRPIKLLEVGCGTGSLSLEASVFVNPGSYIVGIDPEPEMLRVARYKVDLLQLNDKGSVSIIFEKGLIQNMPFKEDCFDVVLCTMVSHHLTRTQKFLGFKEIFRVLKPGGVFINTDFGLPISLAKFGFTSFIKLFIFLYYNVLETVAGNFMELVKDNFTGMLVEIMRKAGFVNVHYMESRFRRAVFIQGNKPRA